MKSIINGVNWYDRDGNIISAHGGGFLSKDNYFYWFGENRNGDNLISCYRSEDLVNWEFCNHVVTKNTHSELNPSNAERPKVLYNEATNQYIMWLHWENGISYKEARCAVLVSDTIDGDYTYLRSFRPLGHMSRDCTLFQDEDGTAYFISAANENADLHVYRLTEDYQDIASLETVLWPGQSREAPSIVKRGDYYYLITSGCTGWHPNQNKYAYATSITGEWSDLIDLGSPTGFDTQPTYILPIYGSEVTTYLYISDRWNPVNYHGSTYVFLPIEFHDEKNLELNWADELRIDVKTGRVKAIKTRSNSAVRIRSTVRYLTASDGTEENLNVGSMRLSYADPNQLWLIESIDNVLKIKNQRSGKYLQPENGSVAVGAQVVLVPGSDHPSQEWIKHEVEEGYVQLQNKHSKLILALNRVNSDDEQALIQVEMDDQETGSWDPQSFLLAQVYDQ